jgi:CRP-like cAMP-binding protein
MRKVVLFGQPRSVPAGETIIQQGDAGRELYMIVSGRVRVFDGHGDGERTLATLEAGAIFGEIAMVSGGVRTANVIADTPTELISLDFDTFNRLRRRFPFTGAKLYRNLAHILSERLRDTTAKLTAPEP